MEQRDGGSRTDRVLEEWSAVAGTARRPVDPVLERGPLTRLRGVSLATAGVVVAVLVATVLLGRGGFQGGVGGTVATDAPTPTTASSPAPSRAPSESPGASARVAACTADDLHAVVKGWEGATGHRIATVEATNTTDHSCELAVTMPVQLVDANGQVLISAKAPSREKTLRLASKHTAQTQVDVDNYCGSPPPAPATIAFGLPVGRRLVATAAADSSNAVPPCLGPGQPGAIQMHAWSE